MTRLDPNGGDRTGPKTTVQLGPSVDEVRTGVVRDSSVEEPEGSITTAASYSKRIQARHRATAALKGRGKPLGGAPPIDPEKAAAIAATMAPQPSFGQEQEAQEMDPQEFNVPQEPPQSLGGVGSSFEINQKMASGEIDRPVPVKMGDVKTMAGPTQPPKKLSQESVEGLEQAQAQIQEEEQVLPPELVDPTDADLAAAEKEMLHRETPFDYENIMQQQSMLVSRERKEAIEGRLSDLDIADMITKREIIQDIPIVAGKLTYTLRTFNQHEHLFCLQYVYENPGSVTYAEEFLNTCKLVCALVAINGARLPDHRKGVGTVAEEIDKDLFQKKMFHVASFPIQIIADLSVQAIWFNQRVNQLLGVENLKNG